MQIDIGFSAGIPDGWSCLWQMQIWLKSQIILYIPRDQTIENFSCQMNQGEFYSWFTKLPELTATDKYGGIFHLRIFMPKVERYLIKMEIFLSQAVLWKIRNWMPPSVMYPQKNLILQTVLFHFPLAMRNFPMFHLIITARLLQKWAMLNCLFLKKISVLWYSVWIPIWVTLIIPDELNKKVSIYR